LLLQSSHNLAFGKSDFLHLSKFKVNNSNNW
jgi:hypothetical protein